MHFFEKRKQQKNNRKRYQNGAEIVTKMVLAFGDDYAYNNHHHPGRADKPAGMRNIGRKDDLHETQARSTPGADPRDGHGRMLYGPCRGQNPAADPECGNGHDGQRQYR